jgi:hypothetical protein
MIECKTEAQGFLVLIKERWNWYLKYSKFKIWTDTLTFPGLSLRFFLE